MNDSLYRKIMAVVHVERRTAPVEAIGDPERTAYYWDDGNHWARLRTALLEETLTEGTFLVDSMKDILCPDSTRLPIEWHYQHIKMQIRPGHTASYTW